MRRRHDLKLERLRELTGIRSADRLIELGQIVDEILGCEPGSEVLDDHYGGCHAVGVVRGAVHRDRIGVVHHAGEVFETFRAERVTSLGAVALVAPAAAAPLLARLLSRLSDSARAESGAAAVDADALPVQVAGVLGDKEANDIRDVLRPAHVSVRRPRVEFGRVGHSGPGSG